MGQSGSGTVVFTGNRALSSSVPSNSAEGWCQSTQLRSIKWMKLLCENLLKNSNRHLAMAGAWGLKLLEAKSGFVQGCTRGALLWVLMCFFFVNCLSRCKMNTAWWGGVRHTSQTGQVYKLLCPSGGPCLWLGAFVCCCKAAHRSSVDTKQRGAAHSAYLRSISRSQGLSPGLCWPRYDS